MFDAKVTPIEEINTSQHRQFIDIQKEGGQSVGLNLVGYAHIIFLDKKSGVHLFEWELLESEQEELTQEQENFLDQDDDGQPGGTALYGGRNRAISYFLWNA